MIETDSMEPLTDRFKRKHTYLRLSVTDRCNLRCFYCMPHEGIDWKPRNALLTFEEMVRLTRLFCQLGITKVRITGGEPTTRNGIEALVEQLRTIPSLQTLAMTTNGLHLAKKASGLKQAGLDVLNISLDTLKPDRFKTITHRDGLQATLHGIDAALDCDFEALKLNMVVMAGINTDEILDFVQLAKDIPLNVRFIEFMPFKQTQWDMDKFYAYAQIKADIESVYPLIPVLTPTGAVAKDYRIPGFSGQISFITSMTESFCSTCNRLRLTAEGTLKPCLFSAEEVDLRDALRSGYSDTELVRLIEHALFLKPEGHAPMTEINTMANRSMIQIGG